jgi:hypothetical protein
MSCQCVECQLEREDMGDPDPLTEADFVNQHTPEPWSIEDEPVLGQIIKGDSQVIAGGFAIIRRATDEAGKEETKANARRIVACVNACAGVSTADLETSPGYKAAIEGFHEQRSLVIAARNERDQLLETLNSINETIFAVGAPLGSDQYFKVRQLVCDALYKKEKKS